MAFNSVRGALGALLVAGALSAQGPRPLWPVADPLHQSGANVTVSLLTVGNGDQVWQMFGHSSIRIHDDLSGRDSIFNWGEFDMRQPNFILHFLLHDKLMLYRLGGASLDEFVYEQTYFKRTLVAQELALTTAQKDSLLHLIRINSEPQNVSYLYDYFADNCATRPRDLLDAVLGGVLRAKAEKIPGMSYRWHALRLMQGDKLLTLGVDLGLGEPSDRPVTEWQEMFLPKYLHDFLATIQVPDSAGGMQPLVRSERVLYQSPRGPEPTTAPTLTPALLVLGLAIGGLIAWLGVRAITQAGWARVVGASVIGLWALVVGLLGTVLALLATVTDHVFAHANENLLLFNPLWVVLAVMIAVQLLTRRAGRATRGFAMGLAGLGVLALLAHVVFLSRQSNLAIIGLALPPALAIAWVSSQAARRGPSGL